MLYISSCLITRAILISHSMSLYLSSIKHTATTTKIVRSNSALSFAHRSIAIWAEAMRGTRL